MLSSRCRFHTVTTTRLVRDFQNHSRTSIRHGSSTTKSISSLYLDTTPPSPDHLRAATLFFRSHTPSKTWTASEWRKNQPHNATPTSNSNNNLPDQLTPEVAFLGRSNSGKSSLLNALLLDPALCRVGPKPGKTITMHAWSLTASPPPNTSSQLRKAWNRDTSPRLNVLDMPGYGHGSRAEWGAEIMKYLSSRRQLKRAFVLLNPVHGLKRADVQMLELLRAHGISWQVVAPKCDHRDMGDDVEGALWRLKGELQAALRETSSDGMGEKRRGSSLGLLTISDILAVGGLGDGKANQSVREKGMVGVEDVRLAVLRATGLDEYALAVLRNGGIPPKVTLAEPSPVPAHTPQAPSPTNNENVGVGIDEFMNMALPLGSVSPTRTSRNKVSSEALRWPQ